MVKRVILLFFGLLILAGCAGQEAPTPAQRVEVEAEAVAEATSPAEPLPTYTSAAPSSPTETVPVEIAESAPATEISPTPTSPTPTLTVLAIQCSGTPTPPNPEGPFYTPNTPEKASLLEEGMAGEPILVSGRVLTTDCEPIAGAKVDFWQTDAAGEYDNVGYRLRGHQFTGDGGNYQLETIVPGQYPGRPAHIHVKIFAPDGRELLTSQLYFPGLSDQNPDGAFDPALQVQEVSSEDGRRQVLFDFVVPAG